MLRHVNLLRLQEKVDAGLIGSRFPGALEERLGLFLSPGEPKLIGKDEEKHGIGRLSSHELAQMIELFLKIVPMLAIERLWPKVGLRPIRLQTQAGLNRMQGFFVFSQRELSLREEKIS